MRRPSVVHEHACGEDLRGRELRPVRVAKFEPVEDVFERSEGDERQLRGVVLRRARAREELDKANGVCVSVPGGSGLQRDELRSYVDQDRLAVLEPCEVEELALGDGVLLGALELRIYHLVDVAASTCGD